MYITAGYDVLGVLHLNREQNDSLSYIILETITAKVVIRFEVRSFLSRGYFLSYSHLAIPAKLHGPKDDRINESLLYTICIVHSPFQPRRAQRPDIRFSHGQLA